MSRPEVAVALLVTAFALTAVVRTRWYRPDDERPAEWFDPDTFRDPRGPVDAIEPAAAERDEAIIHFAFDGERFEYPIIAGFGEDAILDTLADIEALGRGGRVDA